MPDRVVVRIPFGSQITPPRCCASFTASLLEPSVYRCAIFAVLGHLSGRHLWVFGTMVEGGSTVGVMALGGTRRDTAHIAINVGNCMLGFPACDWVLESQGSRGES